MVGIYPDSRKGPAMATPEETPDEPPKKAGLMSIIPLAVVAAGATFGMVWMASSPPEPVVADCSVVEEAVDPVMPVPPEELAARAASYVTLEPLTVALAKDAGAKHARVTVALGVPAEAEPLSDVQFLRLRDRFLERLRAVDSRLILEPAAMPALKQSLLHQARLTLGEDAVVSVLITDFMMK